MNKLKEVMIQTIPLLIGLLFAGILWRFNLLLLLIFLAILFIVLLREYHKGEIIVFFYGLGIGLLIEITGTFIIKYQSFANPDLFGIPLWLPVAWGYAFVMMGRIARILSE